jgi:DNA polymerase elongation subunit (family B)
MKKLAKQLEKLEKNSPEYDAIKGQIDYFDKMQYVMKIRLNSIYGACGNPYFRFYDVRSAESTTRSGREVLMHMVRHIAQLVDGEYTFPSDSIIYGDTDSCYFKTHATTVEEAVAIAEAISKKVNAGFPDFMVKAFLCSQEYKNMIAAEYEFVFDRGIFVNKKLYVLHLAYADGKMCDKMKIMGLQLKKTTIPKHVSKQLTTFVEQLLKGKEWSDLGKEIVQYKEDLLNSPDLLRIGLPKGIKGIEEYTDAYNMDNKTKLPGHVSASMFWNKCLDEYSDTTSVKITSGSKIKVFYLIKPFGRFKSIAIPTDTKKLPEWFNEHYLKLVDRQAQITRLVDAPLENIIGAIGKVIPTRKSLLVDELVEY